MKFSTGARKKENTLRIGSRVCSGALPGGIAPTTVSRVFCVLSRDACLHTVSERNRSLVYKGKIQSLISAWRCTGERSSRYPWTFPEELAERPSVCDADVAHHRGTPSVCSVRFACQQESTATVGLLFVAASRQIIIWAAS